jgi:hypothetical protein
MNYIAKLKEYLHLTQAEKEYILLVFLIWICLIGVVLLVLSWQVQP